MSDSDEFTFEFAPGEIRFGRGSVGDFGDALGERGVERALIVCGENVGANEALMGPVRDGLDDRLAGVFDGTTPEKSIEAALDAAAALDETDADAFVPVGGGSSLDVAKAASVVAAREESADALRREARETGSISLPDDERALAACCPVPTTLAGADLSAMGGISVPAGDGAEAASAGVAGGPLLPDAICYDPALFETTPEGVLRASAMNGFDKGIEALYARNPTPITDATAIRGLEFLRDALPRLGDDADATERAVVGTVLVQYGVSAPGDVKLSVIHAFGHGLRRVCGVQQGIAHAATAPRALELLFERVDARRDELAAALGADGDEAGETAERVVAAVERVRDGLGLPNRLRDVEGVGRGDLPAVADEIRDDPILGNGPVGFDPSTEEIERALDAAW